MFLSEVSRWQFTQPYHLKFRGIHARSGFLTLGGFVHSQCTVFAIRARITRCSNGRHPRNWRPKPHRPRCASLFSPGDRVEVGQWGIHTNSCGCNTQLTNRSAAKNNADSLEGAGMQCRCSVGHQAGAFCVCRSDPSAGAPNPFSSNMHVRANTIGVYTPIVFA